MNKTKKLAALFLALAMVFALAACGETAVTPSAGAESPSAEPVPGGSAEPGADGVWAEAAYTGNTELGEGAYTISVDVTAEDKTVTFTVHTDAENLRAALEPLGLIAGDESELGLYIKTVNGISADYEADGYYWALYIDGEYAMTGVDTTPVTDGGEYALVREAA